MRIQTTDQLFTLLSEEYKNQLSFEKNLDSSRLSCITEVSDEAEKLVNDLVNKQEKYIDENFKSIKESVMKIVPILEKKELGSLNNAIYKNKYDSNSDYAEVQKELDRQIGEYNQIINQLNKSEFFQAGERKQIVQKNPYSFDVVCKEGIVHYDSSSDPLVVSETEIVSKFINDDQAIKLLGIISSILSLCDLLSDMYRKTINVDQFKQIINDKKKQIIAKVEKDAENRKKDYTENGNKESFNNVCRSSIEDLKTAVEKSKLRVSKGTGEAKSEVYICDVNYPIKDKGYLDFLKKSEVLSNLFRESAITLPFIADLKDKGAFLINEGMGCDDLSRELIDHIILSLAFSLSPEKTRMFLVDINDKMNFSPYLELKKLNSDILPSGIIRDKEQIDEELGIIKKCVYDNQDKLGTEGETNIFEYNSKYTSGQLKSNIVVIGGYPQGFSKDQVSVLRNLIRKGKDNGVFFVIVNDIYASIDDNPELKEEVSLLNQEIGENAYVFSVELNNVYLDIEKIKCDALLTSKLSTKDIGQIIGLKSKE